MNTHSHVICTWGAARHLGGRGNLAAVAAGVGAALPDLPYITKAIYLVGRHGRSLTKERYLEQMDYVGEPSQPIDLALHSFVPVGLLLALYPALGVKRLDPHRATLGFLVGWAAHNLLDLPTHSSDARPHLWPFSHRRWKSPLSYWERGHHAVPLLLAEHAAILAVVLVHRRRARAE